MNGVQCEFEAVGDTEFVENVVEMILDGLLGDEKLSPISLLRKP